jgi:hypothetical protein
MKVSTETRRLSKWIFVLGDIFLIGTAWLIQSQADHPLGTLPIVAIMICMVLATVVLVFPFVADYARSQEEAFRERQNALQSLAGTVAAAAEQVSIAAAGLDRLAAIAQENFSQSDRVAQQIHERMGELHVRLEEAKGGGAEAVSRLEAAADRIGALQARLAEVKPDDGAAAGSAEAAAKLEAAAKRIGKAVTELEAAATRAAQAPAPAVTPEVPPVLSSKIVEIKPAAAPSGAPFVSAPPPASPMEPATPPPAPEPLAAGSPPPSTPPPPAAEPPPRKRAPRKPPAESGELVLEPATPAAAEAPTVAGAPDGATRLTVTAYIGIGNRLFIRGVGPGLSWEKGVPLSFVSIGKWRWETAEASAPVRFKLYKNDEIECTALGERSLDPGIEHSLTASF